ncbi:hypothetical protein GCM10007874_15450 [Labrys miyagiensis]|uniref:Uncharacterized protein n=1 Tax=Labrys miyagiensis TaxID=346912 RepID=A0ABQ6CDU3_9HYPH|nr:hypothetical protein [Labrys miyagiensis]GLS18528.1 hypothetical protein GCM10007874_15450 [Labrys miyagiensis]
MIQGANKDKTSSGLLMQCLVSAEQGADFPTVWETILRRHPLITGVPLQTYRNSRPLLEIHLITHQNLIYDSHAQEYTLV